MEGTVNRGRVQMLMFLGNQSVIRDECELLLRKGSNSREVIGGVGSSLSNEWTTHRPTDKQVEDKRSEDIARGGCHDHLAQRVTTLGAQRQWHNGEQHMCQPKWFWNSSGFRNLPNDKWLAFSGHRLRWRFELR